MDSRPITLALAKRLVNAAKREEAAQRRASKRKHDEAQKAQVKADKKLLAERIASDRQGAYSEIELAAGSGKSNTVFNMGSEPEQKTERQAALIRFFKKKGFGAEMWSQYVPETRHHDIDYPDTDSYTLYGVKINW